MRLYLDDDTASGVLAQLLAKAGHDVQVPADFGLAGKADPIHLTQAIGDNRVFLSRNYSDFEDLHLLVMKAQGSHPGIVVIRQDNDPTRDLTPKGVVSALRKVEAAGVPIRSEYLILNHWR